MSYCIYLRKSRSDLEAEEHGEGETLARHEAILLSLAKKQNLNISNIYKEIVSGETISARPVMQKLLSEVEQGMWTGVLVVEVERLARGDTIDQGIVAQAFRVSKTLIITPLKTYDPTNEYDEEYFEFGLFMSRREYKTINRRLQRGRVSSVNEGKYVGNVPPFGYRRVKLPKEKGYTLEPVDSEAEIVKLIYKLASVGELQEDGTYKRCGASIIAHHLNDMGINTSSGKPWSQSTVRGILNNPVYIGKIRWGERASVKTVVNGEISTSRPRSKGTSTLTNGLHPPLIDEATFERVQSYRCTTLPVKSDKTIQNPLAGLIMCAKCGHSMVRRPYNKGNAQDALICPYNSCDNVSSPVALVEGRILKILAEWVDKYSIEWNETEKEKSSETVISELETKLKTIKRELVELKKQKNTAYDLLERNVYSIEVFMERAAILDERILSVDANRESTESTLTHAKEREKAKTDLIPKIQRTIDTYHSISSAQSKNEMLKEIIEKAEYIKQRSSRWHADPSDFQLTLFPRLPK